MEREERRASWLMTTASSRLRSSISQSCIFIVVRVIKSLQDPLKDPLPGISDNVGERGLEQKCFLNADGRLTATGLISRCPASATTPTNDATTACR